MHKRILSVAAIHRWMELGFVLLKSAASTRDWGWLGERAEERSHKPSLGPLAASSLDCCWPHHVLIIAPKTYLTERGRRDYDTVRHDRRSTSPAVHRANLVPPGQVHAQLAAVGVLRLASNRFVGGSHHRRLHHGMTFVTRCSDVETTLAREVIAAVAAVLANALAVALRVALVAGGSPDVRIVRHRPLVVALGAPDRIVAGWRLRCGLCGTLTSWLPRGC
jgi:hypothetical protein